MGLFVVLFLGSATAALSGWAAVAQEGAKISLGEQLQLAKAAQLRAVQASRASEKKVQAFLAAEADSEQPCRACDDKDYSDMCPSGWEADDAAGNCAAPQSYTGKCSKVQALLGVSVAEKMEFELSCDACWSCSKGDGSCLRDWTQPCPLGYVAKDVAYNEFRKAAGIECVASLLYEGECEDQVAFESLDEKHEFAERCGTSWPCQNNAAGTSGNMAAL